MRLQIGKSSTFLDLKADTSLQLDLQSPLYFAENRGSVLPSVKTYSISVPNTPKNRILLGRPAELDNPDDFISEEGWDILFDGYLILSGKLEVEDGLYDGDIRITFIGGLAGNLEVLKTLNLRDLDLEEIPLGALPAESLTTLNELVTDAESDYVFPFVRVNATGELVDDTDDEVDNPLPTTYTFLNYYKEGSLVLEGDEMPFNPPATDTFPFRATVAPQPLLRPLLDKLLEAAQYKLSGVFDNHPLEEELNKLVLFSNYTLDRLLQTNPDGLTFADVALETKYTPARSMPSKKGADLLRAIVNLLCLAPVLDTTGRRLILVACQDLLDNPATINWTAKVDPAYLRGKRLDEIPNNFAYENPEEAYSDGYPKQVRNSQVDYFFETLDEAQAAFTVDDTDLVIYVAELNEYFRTRPAALGPEPYLWLQPLGKSLGEIGEDQAIPFEAQSTTLHEITRTSLNGQQNGWLLPFNINTADVAFGPRLSTAFYGDLQTPLQDGEPLDDIIFLIYRGLIADRDGDQIPFAGSNVYNYTGERIGDMSLLWTGEYGIYKTWWERWMIALRTMRPVNYATRLNAVDLSNLDWREKVIIDRHPYFIKRIQVTLTAQQILPASVEYMQLT